MSEGRNSSSHQVHLLTVVSDESSIPLVIMLEIHISTTPIEARMRLKPPSFRIIARKIFLLCAKTHIEAEQS